MWEAACTPLSSPNQVAPRCSSGRRSPIPWPGLERCSLTSPRVQLTRLTCCNVRDSIRLLPVRRRIRAWSVRAASRASAQVWGDGTRATRYARSCQAAVKLARCSQFGADRAISYRDEDFVDVVRDVTGGHGAEVVLDIMGASYLARNGEALAGDGRRGIIGLQGGATAKLDLRTLLSKRASMHATTLRARPP